MDRMRCRIEVIRVVCVGGERDAFAAVFEFCDQRALDGVLLQIDNCAVEVALR